VAIRGALGEATLGRLERALRGGPGSSLIYLIISRVMSRMTATEAARSFSDVLNRVAAGEEVEITRSGAPVAVIGPPKARLVSAEHFRELIASAPPPDEDFANDVRALRGTVAPPDQPWPS
jgi:antitoxin (DNA-binding transcriptional repressor) of toxin-antitoxin stability system